MNQGKEFGVVIVGADHHRREMILLGVKVSIS